VGFFTGRWQDGKNIKVRHWCVVGFHPSHPGLFELVSLSLDLIQPSLVCLAFFHFRSCSDFSIESTMAPKSTSGAKKKQPVVTQKSSSAQKATSRKRAPPVTATRAPGISPAPVPAPAPAPAPTLARRTGARPVAPALDNSMYACYCHATHYQHLQQAMVLRQLLLLGSFRIRAPWTEISWTR
jgi:hypothetical protein